MATTRITIVVEQLWLLKSDVTTANNGGYLEKRTTIVVNWEVN
jgi:hypothetical protein